MFLLHLEKSTIASPMEQILPTPMSAAHSVTILCYAQSDSSLDVIPSTWLSSCSLVLAKIQRFKQFLFAEKAFVLRTLAL